ncbi:MAG: sensor histidine kinase [Candidatus Hydrothermarchaeaceae archaeon]
MYQEAILARESLLMLVVGLGLLALNMLSIYTFVETKRRLETAVQERASELESTKMRLEASHEELKATYDELSILDRMKDEFLSNVSHELRTPLTSIKGVLDLLAGGEISEEQRELVSLAKRNANRLNALIGDILYYARMEYPAAELNKEELDLWGVIESSVKAMSLVAQDGGIIMETSTEGDLKVLADKKAVYRVLFHLLSNAIKFNNMGGRIMVRARGGENGQVEVCVEDTGIGIPREQLDKIFDRFYQVDGSTKRRYPGTGLGLSLVKGIVEKHGGRIWVETEVDKGSKFTFEIPRGDAQYNGAANFETGDNSLDDGDGKVFSRVAQETSDALITGYVNEVLQ